MAAVNVRSSGGVFRTSSRATAASRRCVARACGRSGNNNAVPAAAAAAKGAGAVVEQGGRRDALLNAAGAVVSIAAGAAVSAGRPEAALAAYGEAANVFGKAKTGASFAPFAGDGYAVLVPGKWNPSKEREFTGMDMRYEDNFDAVNNMFVLVNKTNLSNTEALGDLDKALTEFSFVLGTQAFAGKTQSEGGFKENRVSTAAVLDQKVEDIKGKKYYTWEILTRTADGDEGGRHQLIKAVVSDGKLYVLKIQAGDKRWFKGEERNCRETLDSFQVV